MIGGARCENQGTHEIGDADCHGRRLTSRLADEKQRTKERPVMGEFLETKFEKMGARVKVMSLPDRLFRGPVRIDVRRDKHGEYFDVRHRSDVRVDVIDVKPSDRHLLLMARDADDVKSKFLCGHDERAWFVAAVPETAHAANVQAAKDALKPQ